jgi:hypothetical protein
MGAQRNRVGDWCSGYETVQGFTGRHLRLAVDGAVEQRVHATRCVGGPGLGRQ